MNSKRLRTNAGVLIIPDKFPPFKYRDEKKRNQIPSFCIGWRVQAAEKPVQRWFDSHGESGKRGASLPARSKYRGGISMETDIDDWIFGEEDPGPSGR